MDWKAIFSFLGQRLTVADGAYGLAVAGGQSPKEAAITAAVAAITGGANHARQQAPVVTPRDAGQ